MILGALSDAGGQEYLRVQALVNPTAFLALVGKVLPLQVKADGSDPMVAVRRIVHVHLPDIPALPAASDDIQHVAVTPDLPKVSAETLDLSHDSDKTDYVNQSK